MARRNVGKEIDNFVKTFLMMSKMNSDRDRDDRRDKRDAERMELQRQSLTSRDAQFKESMGLRNRQVGLQEAAHAARVPMYQAQAEILQNKAKGSVPLTPEQRQEFIRAAAGYNGGPGSQYGANRGNGRIHAGVDIGGANGSPAKALGEGKVVYVGQHSGYGNTIDVLNKDGNVQRYALHEGQIGVKVGDEVREGQTIGTVGGRHVHHEVIRKDSDAWREAVSGRFGQTSRVGGRSDQTINPRDYYGARPPSSASNAAGGDPNAAKGSLKNYGALSPDPTKAPAAPDTEKPSGGDDGALPLSSEGGSDAFDAAPSGDDWSASEETALPISGDDWSEEFAEGGMAGETMQPQPAPEAPLPQALDAALKAVQSGYELEREDAALPGTDTARAGRLQAFHQGEGAVSPEQYDALLQGVGGPDPSASALQQIYGFYAQKDPRQAAQAAAGVLQAARARSMQYGQKAAQALDQSDFRGAAQALAAAYNEVPDGRSVTAEVNEQGVGRAIVKDARSGKVVEELRLEPRALMQYASGFMGGGEFYNHLARIAQPSQGPQGGEGAGVPMQSYADGGLVDDDDDDYGDYDDPADDTDDEAESSALPLAEGSDSDGGADSAEPSAEGSDQAPAVPLAQANPQTLQPPAPPPLIPMMGGDNDRAMIQQLNRQMQLTYAQRVREYNAAIAEAKKQAATQQSQQFRQQQTQQGQQFRAGEGEKTRSAAAERTNSINNSRRQSERERREAPLAVDVADKDVVKTFEDALVNGIAETANVAPAKASEYAREQYGSTSLRAMRDAAIEIHRYNRIPSDTAAEITRLMVRPYMKDVDENRAAAPFLVENIDSAATQTGDKRVRVTFHDRDFPPVVLPASTLQQIDIVRGKRAQQMEETQRKDALKTSADTAETNRLTDIYRSKVASGSGQKERARRAFAYRGKLNEGGNAGAIPLGD